MAATAAAERAVKISKRKTRYDKTFSNLHKRCAVFMGTRVVLLLLLLPSEQAHDALDAFVVFVQMINQSEQLGQCQNQIAVPREVTLRTKP